MNKLIKIVLYTFISIPILFFGHCVYNELSKRNGLHELCTSIQNGSSINTFLSDVTKTTFNVRSNGKTDKDTNEWFDREYLHIGIWLKENMKISEDYTVVFTKPGIGYYACIIIHKNTFITKAWFEDRT